jgi:hypothetical protein
MERSDERLSTRDIASPSGADAVDTDPARERDATMADTAPADTAPAPDERADRDFDSGGGAVAADRAAPVGDGDVVTDEPVRDGDVVTDEPAGGRGPSRESIADPAPAGTSGDTAARDTARDSTTNGDAAPLLADSDGFQARWEEIQVRFVDEPRGAVEDADALVATVMQRLAEGFAQERERLEAQWGRGEDISTEDLRVALQRYRSFFQRLLST